MTKIHKTAIIDKGAELGEGVEIGAYSVVGSGVKLGEGAKISHHVVLDGNTSIGSGCEIFPFASIGTRAQDLKYKGAKTFVEIGDKTVIREFATINSATEEGEVTKVGSGCFLMAYIHVAHACLVGDGVIMANCGTLAGHVVVENQAIIGGLVGVHQFVRIGRMCMIGGCSKITQDCPPFTIIDGNPAMVRGLNTVGLKRKGIADKIKGVLKEAYKILYRQGLSTDQALEKIVAELEPCAELTHFTEFIRGSKRGIIK